MSKLLLSTSMVVALMAINPALHAVDPEPVFDPITVDQNQENKTTVDEVKLQTEEQVGNTEEAASEAEMQVLQKDESSFSADAKKAFEDLKKDHEALDSAIKAAKEADNPEAQQTEFVKVEDALTQVEDSANKLADELKVDPKEADSAKAIASDSENEKKIEEEVANDTKALENVDETPGEVQMVAEDAKLTPEEDMKIAGEMKDKVGEIKKSVDAATEIQQGLKDSGLDAKDDKLVALNKALENLNAILFDIQGAQKGKTVSKK